MLQVFYLDVAYVAMAIHVCFKFMFQMFQLFQTYVASVLSRCCIYCTSYTRMLQVYVSNVSAVSNVRSKCFIWMLHMLQWLYTYVANVCLYMFRMFQTYVAANAFMLQVLHDQAREVGADGGGPLGRSVPHVRAGSKAGAVAPTCMRTAVAGGLGSAGTIAAARGCAATTAAASPWAGRDACMHYGARPGKVGGGGTVHTTTTENLLHNVSL
jgi:hypothetical protein